jgi:hypothetical protein
MKKMLYCLLGVALAIVSMPLLQRATAQRSTSTRILISPVVSDGTDS